MKLHVQEEVQVGETVSTQHDRQQINQAMMFSFGQLNWRMCMILLMVLLTSGRIHFNMHRQKQVSRTIELSTIAEPKIEERKKADLTWNDIELVSFVRFGSISAGFKARIKGREGFYIVKITGDDFLHWSDTEIEMFKILNAPPTIPNIPKLELAIRSMPNPFHNRTYLERTLGVDDKKDSLSFLMQLKNISVIVMEFLDDNRFPPTSVSELRIFLRSLLSALSFSHSRNVMMCDLHSKNVYFDGTTAKLFDWNAGFIYKRNSVKMHYKQEPKHLMPPEAWHNKSAVHATVSGFDIWTIGLLLEKVLEKMDKRSFDDTSYELLMHFMKATLTRNPYKRPDADKLLHHIFLRETLPFL